MECRALFAPLMRESGDTTQWVFMVDNSGSMGRIRNPIYEAIVIMSELMRRLEAKFAIATLGDVVINRSATARVTGAIAKEHGNRGWRGSLHLIFTGCAGQAFGFACLPGLDLEVCP